MDRAGEMTGEQTSHVQLSIDRSAVTVRMRLSVRRRGGRKVIVSPPGTEPWSRPSRRPDNPLVNALARAFRWKHLLDAGAYTTITDIAKAEKLDRSFVSNCLRLTLLAPALVESILAETRADGLRMQALMRSLPSDWGQQAVFVCRRDDAS